MVSESNPHGLYVGQKLWYVPNDQRWQNPCEVQVISVGRAYARVGGSGLVSRIELIWLRDASDPNFMFRGVCWLSQKAYEESKATDEAFHRLRAKLCQVGPAKDVTVGDIHAAAKLLRIEI